MRISNTSGVTLLACFTGPGGKDRPGTIEGAAPLPNGKVQTLPDDLVSLKLLPKPPPASDMDETHRRLYEMNWSGRYLEDAE